MTESLPKLAWTPEMVVRFWDFESNFPDRYFTYHHGAEMVRQLGQHLLDRGDVLDYGCGPGYLLDELLTAGIKAAGFDSSPETVRKVNERFHGRPSFLGAFTPEQLGDNDRRFSVITVVEVIEHLYDETLEELLDNLVGLIAPDGVVVFTTPNEEDLEKSSMLCPVSGEVYHRWQHVRSWSRESLTNYLEAKNYQVLQCFATNFRGGLSKAKNKGALGTQWAVLKSRARRMTTKKRPPHLVAIAQPRTNAHHPSPK